MNVYPVESGTGRKIFSALFVMLPKPDESEENPLFDFRPSTIQITNLSIVLKEAYNGQNREHCVAGIIP